MQEVNGILMDTNNLKKRTMNVIAFLEKICSDNDLATVSAGDVSMYLRGCYTHEDHPEDEIERGLDLPD